MGVVATHPVGQRDHDHRGEAVVTPGPRFRSQRSSGSGMRGKRITAAGNLPSATWNGKTTSAMAALSLAMV